LRDLAPIVDMNDDQCGLDPRLILFTASTGCAMTVLDTNVVGIVLPTIARDLGASFAEIARVISTYVLCFCLMLLSYASVLCFCLMLRVLATSRRVDRLPLRATAVFLIGIGIFAVETNFLTALEQRTSSRVGVTSKVLLLRGN
jgi:MFS family permease